MKISIAIVLSLAALINAAAIESKAATTEPLFSSAWSYQTLLTNLQDDINAYLTKLRTAVSIVLKSSSNETLHQIEDNALAILDLDEPVRDAIYAQSNTVCIVNLRVLLNAATEFTGFGSSNCAAAYDQSVQAELTKAYAELRSLEAAFGDVQQIVVKSFSKQNAFTQQEVIENNFVSLYNQKNSAWAATKGDVEGFVNRLKANIAVLNGRLGNCFSAIQVSIAPAYVALEGEIATCNVFDNTADPFAVFRL